MEPPPEGPAAALGIDLIRVIASQYPCLFPRLVMSAGCRLWRTAIFNYGPVRSPLPSLPILLVPRSEPPSACCLLCGGERHDIQLPDDALRARFLGSWPGGWVFLALGQTEGHTLINLRSGERIPLPDTMRRLVRGSPGFRVVIQAATLSSQAIDH